VEEDDHEEEKVSR
jgi:phosphatidylinositol kinase/protein kinase (PI-3  family)